MHMEYIFLTFSNIEVVKYGFGMLLSFNNALVLASICSIILNNDFEIRFIRS
jgi:hypothetical protein